MQRLVYSFERVHPSAGSPGSDPIVGDPIVGDVIVAIAMAAVGIVGVQRRVDGPPEAPQALLTFPNDKTLLRFNLRIERALALRNVRIAKIRIVDDSERRIEQRAVA